MGKSLSIAVALLLVSLGAPWAEEAANAPADGGPGSTNRAPAMAAGMPAGQDGPACAAKYELPGWFDGCRVQAHTRLNLPYLRKSPELFFSAAARFKDMGARVFTRHIKSGDEGAWWPSQEGIVAPEALHRNLAREIIDEAHKQGLRIIAYHRHMEDAGMAEKHPDWVCVDPTGESPEKGEKGAKRGKHMCFNSPYADYFLKRSLELVDLGADGFYYDEVHMPKTGCWCPYCRDRFKKETGLDHPSKVDPRDPTWQKLINFNNLTVERTFLKWREALHARKPDIVMLVSHNTWPGMAERHLTSRLARISDSVKTEFFLPARKGQNRAFERDASMLMPDDDVRLALGYTLCRDAADGRPAHIWTHGLLSEDSTLYATAGMIAHGNIANLDVGENSLPNPMFKKAFSLGDRVSPHLAGTRPLHWALLHYPEGSAAALATDPDPSARWKKACYPFLGAYRALLRAHLPVGVITDPQMEEGIPNDCRVLFLPVPGGLTEPMRKAVEKFRVSGGMVIEQRPEWAWHDPNGGRERAEKAFLHTMEEAARAVPVRVSGGPEKLHAVTFKNHKTGALVIALANDFSWVFTGSQTEAESLKKEERLRRTTPPPPCKGVTITLRLGDAPRKALEVVSGKTPTLRTSAGATEVEMPTFDSLAVVVIAE